MKSTFTATALSSLDSQSQRALLMAIMVQLIHLVQRYCIVTVNLCLALLFATVEGEVQTRTPLNNTLGSDTEINDARS